MAAALFQQLQQQNPALLQNLVGQHQFANSLNQPVPQPTNTNNRVNVQRFNNGENAVKCTAVPQSPPAQKPSIAGIPAPPVPHNAINRKNTSDVSGWLILDKHSTVLGCSKFFDTTEIGCRKWLANQLNFDDRARTRMRK